MRVKTWKIIDYGRVPVASRSRAEVPCERCGREAFLPVLGLVIAVASHGGVYFDVGDHALPRTVQCRRCRYIFTTDPEPDHVR